MTKISLSFFAAVFLFALSARADEGVWFNGGAKGTAGTQSYFGSDWWAQLGKGDYSVKPMFSEYRSDTSSGTYKTVSARAAYDSKLFGAGLTLGGTPKVNGYSNGFVGVDAILSITPGLQGPTKRINSSSESAGPARGKGVARIDLGGAIKHYAHRDDLQAAPGQAGRRGGAFVARSGGQLRLGETDFTASGGVSILDALLSIDLTKSVYDKNLTNLNARALQNVRLSGLASTIQGFPDTNTAVRLELGMLPLLTPYVTYVHTKYKLAQPDSNGVTAGVYAELDIVELSGSYEHLAQSGQPDENYYSLGASVRF